MSSMEGADGVDDATSNERLTVTRVVGEFQFGAPRIRDRSIRTEGDVNATILSVSTWPRSHGKTAMEIVNGKKLKTKKKDNGKRNPSFAYFTKVESKYCDTFWRCIVNIVF